MYNVSTTLNDALLDDNRILHSRVTIGTYIITDGIVSIKHVMQSNSSTNITVGSAVSSYVEIKMWKPDDMVYSLDNYEIKVEIGVEIDSAIEYIPLGYFTISNPSIVNGYISFTAYDRMQSKLSGAFFSDLTYPADAKDILNEIAQKTGLTINATNLPSGVKIDRRAKNTSNTYDENGNPITTTEYEKPFTGYTYRESIGYIAMLFCKFAIVDRTGSVVFKWYDSENYSIGASDYYDDLSTTGTEFKVSAISCNSQGQAYSAGSGLENIQLENPVMTQDRMNYIYNQIKNLCFVPASCSFYGNILLDAGDIITVTDINGEIVKIPAMIITHEFDGGLKTSIQSYGGTDGTTTNTSPTLTKLDRTYTELLYVKEIVGQKADFEYVHGIKGDFDTLSAKQATFENETVQNFTAVNSEIQKLNAKSITTDNLSASVATLGYLKADDAEITYLKTDELESKVGAFGYLKADEAKLTYLSTKTAEITYLKTDELESKVGAFGYLKADELETQVGTFGYLKAKDAKLEYAQIDFANVTQQVVGSELIKDSAITDAKILNVSANKLTAGTIDASKITVTNLNADNITVGTINGKIIGTGTVDLDKLSKEVPTKEYLDSVQNGLQDQIDKSIQTYSVTEIPTLNNNPASGWSTEDYSNHVGDVCYVKNAGGQADGYTYRFDKNGSTYGWILIKDSQVTDALQQLITVNGDISGLKSFQSETSSWITKTDSELTSLKGQTTELETELETKVSTQTWNELKQTVDGNSSTITTLTDTVSKKADGSTVSALSNTVNTVKQTADANTTKISTLTDTVSKKADGSTVSALSEKATKLEQNLDGFKTEVSSTYTTKEESKNYVDVKTYKTYTEQTDNAISLCAKQTTTDALTQRVSTAESTISAQANQITLKVDKDSIISTINQSAEAVAINANKINLDGYLTVTNLAKAGMTIVDGGSIIAEKLTLTGKSSININDVFTVDKYGNFYATSGQVGSLHLWNTSFPGTDNPSFYVSSGTATIEDSTLDETAVKKINTSTECEICFPICRIQTQGIYAYMYSDTKFDYSVIYYNAGGKLIHPDYEIGFTDDLKTFGDVTLTKIWFDPKLYYEAYTDEKIATFAYFRIVLSVPAGAVIYYEKIENMSEPRILTYNCNSLAENQTGIYIGTDGFSIGHNTVIDELGNATFEHANIRYAFASSMVTDFLVAHTLVATEGYFASATVNGSLTADEIGIKGGVANITSTGTISGANLNLTNAISCASLSSTGTISGASLSSTGAIYAFEITASSLINTTFEYQSNRGVQDWRFGARTGTSDDNQFGFYDTTYGFHGSFVGSEHSLRMQGSMWLGRGFTGSENAMLRLGGIKNNDTVNVYTTMGTQMLWLQSRRNGAWIWQNVTETLAKSSSDIRLKTNIRMSDVNALDAIKQMKVKSFDRIDENGSHYSIGFIADELEEINPILVSGGGYTPEGHPYYKSINELYLASYAIKGIQELHKKVNEQSNTDEQLMAEIKSLEGQIESLRNKLHELEMAM